MPNGTKRWFWLFSLLIGLAPLAGDDFPATQVTLLFAGSSSTYWNDLPREVAQLVDRKIDRATEVRVAPAIVGRSGSDIRVYVEPGFKGYEYGVKPGQTFLDKLQQEQPRWLVLQVVCSFITDEANGAGAAHAAAITQYCTAVRAAGGEPVFYEMGWGQGEREAAGRQRIIALAIKNQVRYFAPCSSAWARVRQERPELALQHPQDGAHPGDLGHFLNLACFSAALTRTSPVGTLPRSYHVWPHALPKAQTDEAQAEVAAAIARYPFDDYQRTLPKWMHRNIAASRQHMLDDATARYLETVAWETWQTIDKQRTARREEQR